jgi:shikimate dehydrogenase
MSKHFALIGYPLTFSMSPDIYIPWFRKYNIDATYEVIPLKEKELDNFFRNQARNYFDGINITTPYKETAIKFVDELSDLAKMTGSINCIKRQGNRLIADNTDIYGFSEMVSDIDFTGKTIIIVGAGGAAISALHVLAKYNPDVMNRTDRNVLGKKTISYEILKLQNYDIIINATTIALFSLLDFSLDQKILIDLNYKFTDEYKNIPNIMTGEKMLLKQAEKAFQIWFGL